MANYLSQPTKYGEPKSQFNAELASKVLQAKQGQYDINKARVDAVLGEYQNLEFINAKAKEDFYNNIQGVLNEVNSSNLRDLGDTSVADKILGSINKALTPETLKHNQIAKAYYASEKKWEKLFEKDPKLHDLGNKQYVERVSGINDYMQNGDYSKVNLGMLTNPIEYVNHQENGVKNLKALKDARGKEVKEWFDSNGLEYKLDTSYLSKSDIFMLRDHIYSEKDKRQMRIEGSNKFSNMSDEQVRGEIEKINAMKMAQVDQDLMFYDTIKGTDYLTDEEKKSLNQNKAALRRYKEQLKEYNYDAVRSDENSYLYMVENEAVYNLATVEGVDPSSKVSMPPHVYKKIQKDREAKEEANKPNRIPVYTLPTSPQDEKDLYENRQNDLRSLNGEISGLYKDVYRNMTRDMSEAQVEATRSLVTDNDSFRDMYPDATEEDIVIAYIDMYKNDYKTKSGDSDIEGKLSAIESVSRRRESLMEAQRKAEGLVDKEMVVGLSDSIYNSIVDTGEWSNTYMTDSQGNEVNVKEYLDGMGISSKEDMLEFMEGEDSYEFKAAIQADKVYKTLKINDNTGGIGQEPILEAKEAFRKMSSELGENLELEDVYDFYMQSEQSPLGYLVSGITGSTPQEVKLTPEQVQELVTTGMVEEQGLNNLIKPRMVVKQGMEVSKSNIMLASQEGIQNKRRERTTGENVLLGVGISAPTLYRGSKDRTLTSNASVRNATDPSKYRETYNREMNRLGMGKVNVGFVVPSTKKDDPLHKQIETLSGVGTVVEIDKRNRDKKEITGKFILKNDRPTYIAYNELSRDLVTVSQLDNDGVEVGVDVPIGTVRELAPNLYSRVMEYTSEEKINYKVDLSRRNDNVNYVTDSAIIAQRGRHYNNPNIAILGSKDGAKKYLTSGVVPGENYEEVIDIINKTIDNSKKFSVEIESSQSTEIPYYKINLYHGEDNKIGELTPPRGETAPTETTWSLLEVMPSTHMTTILRSAVVDYSRRGRIEDSEILMNLRSALQNTNQ